MQTTSESSCDDEINGTIPNNDEINNDVDDVKDVHNGIFGRTPIRKIPAGRCAYLLPVSLGDDGGCHESQTHHALASTSETTS